MAKKKLIIPKQIVTVDDNDSILSNHAIEVEGNKISSITLTKIINLDDYDGEVFNFPYLTLIPGFVQKFINMTIPHLNIYSTAWTTPLQRLS